MEADYFKLIIIFMMKIRFYWLASRPKTLIISLSLWLTGMGLVIQTGRPVDFFLNSMILFCMMCLQIAVNYFNDALDFINKKDTAQRLGPRRMVQSGLISANSMMRAGWLAVFLALLSGAYLVFQGGWVIFLIGASGIGLAYFYSAPSFSLANKGLSEIFVFLYFGLLAVWGIFHLNGVSGMDFDSFSGRFFYWDFSRDVISAFIAGSQMGLLSVSVLLVNYLRDAAEDTLSGKKTWVVRKGFSFGLMQWAVSVALSYIIGVYWLLFEGNWRTAIWPLILLPVYVFIFYKLKTEKPGLEYNFYLALTSLSQFLFALCLFLSFIST